MHLALLLQLNAALAQLLDDLLVMLVLEKAVDLMGDFQPDIRQIDQHIRQCPADAIERTQGARQQLGGALAHIRNAQGIDEARQGRAAAGFDGFDQVAARYFSETFQRQHLLERQAIEVSR